MPHNTKNDQNTPDCIGREVVDGFISGVED